jgi:hypothetical protein
LFLSPPVKSAYKLPSIKTIIPINAIHVKTSNKLQYLTLKGPATEENKDGFLESLMDDWFSAEGLFWLGCCK